MRASIDSALSLQSASRVRSCSRMAKNKRKKGAKTEVLQEQGRDDRTAENDVGMP